MKTLWTAITIVVLLNILLLGAGLLWLKSSGRLNAERVRRVGEMFALTIDEEQQQQAQADALEEQSRQQAMDLARLESVSDGPISLADRLEAQQQRDDLATMRLDRLKRDIRDLQQQLELSKRLLAEKEAQLQADRQAFEQALAQQQQLQQDENFQQTVSMYEQLKPKQAKQMFRDLIERGQIEQVVDYLAAMQLRKAAGAIKQFKSPEEITQAAELLQRLRERGIDLKASDPTLASRP